MGMSNSFATIPGFLGPEIVGWLTNEHVSICEVQGQHVLIILRLNSIYKTESAVFSSPEPLAHGELL